MNCPQCQGPMTDQTATKQNPKQPDFTCQNPGCVNEKGYRTGVWTQKKQAPRNGGAPTAPAPRAAKWTWKSLQETYRKSVLIAQKQITALVPNATPADVVAGAATVFITASRDGIQPEPSPPQPLTEKPKQLTNDDDSDIPF